MAVKPLSPDEAQSAHQGSIPDAVIEEVNALLAREFYNPRVTVTIHQNELLEALAARELSSKNLFDNHWLDFELLFEAEGWTVKYDKPGHNEFYGAFWVFRKKTEQSS